VLLLEDIKRKSKPAARNGSANLWDIGDGVFCLEFRTKMNALDGDIMDLLAKSLDTVKRGAKALVIYNEGTNFSVGANVGLALFAANLALWPMIEELEAKGQAVFKAM
jgi:3-hydroxyacyl-CoA dehydrogenase